MFSGSASCSSTLGFETESYTSSTGAIVDWVDVPSESAGTVIYACYDNAAVSTDQSNATATWNGNYAAVYHLNEANLSSTAATPIYDSTAHALTLTAGDTNSNESNGYLISTSSGEIDGAADSTRSTSITAVTRQALLIQASGVGRTCRLRDGSIFRPWAVTAPATIILP